MTAGSLLAEPLPWAKLDYTRLTEPNVHAELAWTIAWPGAGHGISVWFETRLFEDVGFSAAPDKPPTIYGQAFFPWERPISLVAGDRVSVTLWARLTGGDYAWHWHTRVDGAEEPGQPKRNSRSRPCWPVFTPGQLAGYLSQP